jgi:hypothetical protein
MDFSKYTLSEKQLKGEISIAEASSAPVWNRLEVSPRNADSSSAFKAEIWDALWMLTRQWQLGEFIGDDAGSLAFTNLTMHCNYLDAPSNVPLETLVEQQPVFYNTSTRAINLQLRLQMGYYWLKLLSKNGLGNHAASFINNANYKIKLPADLAEREAAQVSALATGRGFDGFAFYSDQRRFDNAGAQADKFKELFKKLQAWYDRHIKQPQANANQWQPDNMEYRFNSKLTVKSLTGNTFKDYELGTKEYYQGRLDWYNFEVQRVDAANARTGAKATTTLTYPDAAGRNLIPGPVSFDGMPEKRYWSIEDAHTNFAAVKPDKLDLGKMALIEFALIYGGDWHLVPVKAPVGSFLQVKQLEVVDSFGKKTNIPFMGDSLQSTWDQWQFFALNNATADKLPGLLLPPAVGAMQHSKPLEEVVLIRDEVANLIWGIETIVPGVMGNGVPGREVGTQEQKRSNGTVLTYQAQTTVPKNWIPFIAVQHPTIPTRVVVRRGSMLDENNQRIRPYTALLRKGIDSTGAQTASYDIDENEIGREGAILRKTYQRTRWTNGEVYVWLGIQKTAGKGEGNSALKFDQLVFK